MPSDRNPRPRAFRRSGLRRFEENWLPGTRTPEAASPPEPPEHDGAGAAALERLQELAGKPEPEVEVEATASDPADEDRPASELIDELREQNEAWGAPPPEGEGE